jgi:predicted MPP superfamily phosphohydrolase
LLSGCGPSPARGGDLRRVVEVPGEPRSVVWAVQLSDLHLSSFHPERAADFRRHVGDALAMVKPGLVLITGDLTRKLPPAFFACVCLKFWLGLV